MRHREGPQQEDIQVLQTKSRCAKVPVPSNDKENTGFPMRRQILQVKKLKTL